MSDVGEEAGVADVPNPDDGADVSAVDVSAVDVSAI
jgi:hypothetical protein